MCFLQYADEAASRAIANACAHAGLLFKRSAYNFVSLAHTERTIDRSLDVLSDALSTAARPA
jgi:glutamate-1-semialdehyde aminotransferase